MAETAATDFMRPSGLSKDEISRIAYESTNGIEFLEMNDGVRLGYHMYLYLTNQLPSISEAIYEAKARSNKTVAELEEIIRTNLHASQNK